MVIVKETAYLAQDKSEYQSQLKTKYINVIFKLNHAKHNRILMSIMLNHLLSVKIIFFYCLSKACASVK